MRVIDALKVIERVSEEVETPWCLKRAFKDIKVEAFGDQITFGEDFLSITEARESIEALVYTLGGKVEWEEEDE